MKKFLVAALALVCSGSAFAIDNEPEEGLSTQVFLGMTTSSIQNLNGFDGKVGGTAGIKFDYMLPNAHGTYINAGLDWIMKGAKETYKDDILGIGNVDITNKIPTHYIELPVHVGFRYNIMQDLGVYGEVGPYFSFGVGGKYKHCLDADGANARDKEYDYSIFKKQKTDRNFQRWDAGFGFRVGCEYQNHYSLNLGCDWGFTDMWRDSYRDAVHDNYNINVNKIKNFAFTLSFGYRF